MKVHLRMLGCRLNQSEIDTMARQLQQQGHEIVSDPAQADHFIVNTCAVTNQASADGRKLIRELHRSQQDAEITVTGCYAQIAPDEIQVLPGVQKIVNNQDKDQLVPLVTGMPLEPFDHEPLERDAMPGARTRAFVKVQDGCDNACTFCVTTIARGDGQSRPIEDVVHEVRYLHDLGYQEAVLTGVHLGSYGYDFGDRDGLVHLVHALLADTDIPRLRLSSLEPWDLSDNFFDLWQSPRICRHLHLPLQSGCDKTLKRMARHTSQQEFRKLIKAAKSKIENVRITTDVIVGFPGETDSEFASSKSFIEEMEFGGLHVFRYSIRPGTPAARMKNHVNEKTKKKRSSQLLKLSRLQEDRFAQNQIGKSLEVLWERVSGATEAGFINEGFTDNYVRVRCVHPRDLSNLISPATVTEFTEGNLITSPVIK